MENKIIGSTWFTEHGSIRPIGVVIYNDGFKDKAVIGTASGYNQHADESHITKFGASFPLDLAIELVSEPEIIFKYKDRFKRSGICGLRVLGEFVIVTELPENTGASITNSIEVLVPQVLIALNKNLNEIRWIEYYPSQKEAEYSEAILKLNKGKIEVEKWLFLDNENTIFYRKNKQEKTVEKEK